MKKILIQFSNLSKSSLRKVAIATVIVSALISWLFGAWLALPFGLLFAVFTPGLSILLSIRRKLALDWSTATLSIGLGVAFVIFTLLTENWILKAFGDSAPLRPAPVFLSISLTTLVLLFIGYPRWANNPIEYLPRPSNKYGKIAIISSLLILLMLFIGAIRLNNGANGIFSVVGYIASVVLIVYLYVAHKKLTTSTIITSLWLVSFGLILSGWLRTNYVAGPDVDIEFRIFQAVKDMGFWSIDLYRNAYNACLSVSILPTGLSYVTKVPDVMIFKFVMPLLYSFVVPVVFLISNTKFNKRVSVLATFFFISQPPFTTWWWIPIRQQMAFLFFALIILILVKQKNDIKAKALIMILGLAMAVSHYSTTYVSLGLLAGVITVRFVINLFLRRKAKVASIVITPMFLLILFIFTFLWYSQLTYGFNGITSFVGKSFANIGSLFSSDVQQSGQKPLDRFNVFNKSGSPTVTIDQYQTSQSIAAKSKYGSGNLYTNGQNYDNSMYDYVPYGSKFADNISMVRSLLKAGGNLLICLGILIISVSAWRKREFGVLTILQITALIFLGLVLFLPFFSISYGADRLYQQLLMIFASAIGAGIEIKLIGKLTIAKFSFLLPVFVILYFLTLNQVLLQFTSTSQNSFVFSNSGMQYVTYYVTANDAQASRWVFAHSNKDPIYSDGYSQYRLISTSDLTILQQLHSGVLPSALPKQSYVFQSTANTITQTGFDRYQGDVLYKFPSDFLSNVKNTIYSNGNDEIYK